MPSYVTYHIFAATVQRVTSDSVAHIASSYPAAYRWGSQGPDPLALYHAPFPSALRRLANRVCTEPPAPLLKHKYASERRQAKILNFSLAYGWKQRVFVDTGRRRTDCRRISACRWRRRRKCLRSGTKSVRK